MHTKQLAPPSKFSVLLLMSPAGMPTPSPQESLQVHLMPNTTSARTRKPMSTLSAHWSLRPACHATPLSILVVTLLLVFAKNGVIGATSMVQDSVFDLQVLPPTPWLTLSFGSSQVESLTVPATHLLLAMIRSVATKMVS